ncbi:CHRD domain-containing protein [Bacillus sp. Xin]|uniref:CHRD domain-containing protein n=1 Tax=unclassified Bacillus (in: firmicutes) TaxID=185979 RepID=UPI0015727CFE|nr:MULTISPECIES: CHRD domain-containing protein [unclassified Bacillus (in: firmicutes)]MBC6973425.1 CHRD domain-containing protein [Bacillus sp. Xin]NSW35572.1 CHRD domain-containing protein [Bacillus sp. Xin1]
MSTCFISKLTGREEVPPVYTDAFGIAQFRFNNDFTKLQFKLVVHDIEQVTAAHIHLGDRGENGPVVVFLFGPVTRGISVDRGVVTGIISETDLVGSLQNMSLLELANRMNTGNTYVNVHTEKHPPGQIRGQIRRF